MSVVAIPAEQHFVLTGMDWQSYEALLRAVGEHRVFITYDGGRVELMYPSWEHENRSETIAQLIRAVAEGLGAKVKSGGSTTFRREDVDRGLEPDKCFYVRHEEQVRHKQDIDLSIDPPPDLCVEVEISRRILDRGAIYAKLGVPELWRDDGRRLRVMALSAVGVYEEAPHSAAFPSMSVEDLNELLERSATTDELSWVADVREWVRANRGRGAP